jgi:hypothetical protein
MENPASFRLSDAIQEWRQNVEVSGNFQRDEVDELEAHLRDAVNALTAQGVPTSEAFRRAAQKLGPTTSIAQEFDKLRPYRRWFDRAFWILAGMLLIKIPVYLGALGLIPLLYSIAAWTGRGDVAIAVASLVSLLIKASLVLGFWKFVSVPRVKLKAIALLCARRPLVPILAGSILLLSVNPLFRWLHNALTPASSTLPDLGMPAVRGISISAYVFEALLWLALPFWLARLQASLQNETVNVANSPDDKSEIRDDSCSGEGHRERWLGRCLWISIGVALSAVTSPLLDPIGRIAHGVSSFVTNNRDWQTVAWAAGRWITTTAFVAAAIWLIRRHPKFCMRAKHWIGRQPLLAFLATTGILFGLCLASSMAAAATTSTPHLSSVSEQLVRDIPSLAFLGALFWLGRQQFIRMPRHEII